jgi:hypothetical protein
VRFHAFCRTIFVRDIVMKFHVFVETATSFANETSSFLAVMRRFDHIFLFDGVV